MPGPRPGTTGTSVVALVGPTASGKSALALEVAARVNQGVRPTADRSHSGVELVSVDSMAVYRGMDIGTAKPTTEVRARVPYHLVDLVEASEEFTVQRFQRAAHLALDGIAGRGNAALLVGGTGLYLRSVVDDLRFPGRYPEEAAALNAGLDRVAPAGTPQRQEALVALHGRLAGLDAVAAGRIEATNERRLVRALEVTLGSGLPFSTFGPGLEQYPPSQVTLLGTDPGPEALDVRIAERFEGLMADGLLDEVRELAGRPGGMSRTARQALGYREVLAHLEEGVPLSEAVDLAIRRTRTFARRQRAWFRRDPRILWLDGGDDPADLIVAALGTVPEASVGVGE
jgi:tRNA dimethylallyltransferase